MTPRRRVVVYALRGEGARRELLVFDHRDHPDAGTQVPAGGIKASEEPAQAAARELLEETGLVAASISFLAQAEEAHPNGNLCDNSYFLAAVNSPESTWMHRVSAGAGDAGLVFRCRFVPLREAEHVVHASQRTFLSELSAQ